MKAGRTAGMLQRHMSSKKKGKAIPVTGHEGP
jgi:hypothetical protein